MPKPLDLGIPFSQDTVQVYIIDTTTFIGNVSLAPFIEPQIRGHTTLECPSFSFLIEHPSGRKLLFDLGIRKDYWNYSPFIQKRIRDGNYVVRCEKGVREQLEEHGVSGGEIEAIIWSHWHWDHLGDPSTFDSHTVLIVGPGFKEALLPAYPENPSSPIQISDFAGRELREITFDYEHGPKVGKFHALDYFGDGSFYLLDAPGHAVGHLCGFARVTNSPATFILMGADACHHGGVFRPSKYLPLPCSISPHPFDKHSQIPCPGSIFEHLLRDGDKEKPFFVPAQPADRPAISYDIAETKVTIEKVQETDCHSNILVVMAHDESITGAVDFFPKSANNFAKQGCKSRCMWGFLKDFKEAIR